MLSTALLPFFLFSLLALVPQIAPVEGDEDETLPEPDEPEGEEPDLEEPETPEPLAGSFTTTEDGVTIEVDDPETTRLAVITYVDTEDESADVDFLQTHEARYYLVPEGVDWPDATTETQYDVPGSGSDLSYELADFEETFGLTLLGTVDLLAAGNTTPTDTDMVEALPPLTANVDPEYYYLEANTDGDDLIRFVQEGYIETRNGATETVVTESVTGTDASEWYTTQTNGVTIEGAGGDDTLDGTANDLALQGGAGNDTITATGARAVISGGDGADQIDATGGTIFGGAGEDEIDVTGSDEATVFGDDGDDLLVTTVTAASQIYGGAGNDNLQTGFNGGEDVPATLFGGEGDDFLAVGPGATGFGDEGADALQINAGGAGFGGAGDDTLTMYDFFSAPSGTIFATGGAGADTFDVWARNVTGTPDQELFAQIEDFDSSEDVLVVSRFSPTDEILGLDLAEDPDGAFTDVNIDYAVPEGGTATVTVRLMGTVDVNAADIVLR